MSKKILSFLLLYMFSCLVGCQKQEVKKEPIKLDILDRIDKEVSEEIDRIAQYNIKEVVEYVGERQVEIKDSDVNNAIDILVKSFNNDQILDSAEKAYQKDNITLDEYQIVLNELEINKTNTKATINNILNNDNKNLLKILLEEEYNKDIADKIYVVFNKVESSSTPVNKYKDSINSRINNTFNMDKINEIHNAGLYIIPKDNGKSTELEVVTENEFRTKIQNTIYDITWDDGSITQQYSFDNSQLNNIENEIFWNEVNKLEAARVSKYDGDIKELIKSLISEDSGQPNKYRVNAYKGNYIKINGIVTPSSNYIKTLHNLSGTMKNALREADDIVYLLNNPNCKKVKEYKLSNKIGDILEDGSPAWVNRSNNITAYSSHGEKYYNVLNKTFSKLSKYCDNSNIAFRGWTTSDVKRNIETLYNRMLKIKNLVFDDYKSLVDIYNEQAAKKEIGSNLSVEE